MGASHESCGNPKFMGFPNNTCSCEKTINLPSPHMKPHSCWTTVYKVLTATLFSFLWLSPDGKPHGLFVGYGSSWLWAQTCLVVDRRRSWRWKRIFVPIKDVWEKALIIQSIYCIIVLINFSINMRKYLRVDRIGGGGVMKAVRSPKRMVTILTIIRGSAS